MKTLITIICYVLMCIGNALGQSSTSTNKKYASIQKYLDKATTTLSGVVVFVNHPKWGQWTGASGYADLNLKLSMNDNHIFSLASIGKLYNAVAVLKLAQDGKLSLDDKIAKYLPDEVIGHIPFGDQYSIRHLLGQKTGYANYERDPILNDLYLSGKLKLDTLEKIDVLRRYFYSKPLHPSGKGQFYYSSTNYLLLAMIMDEVTGDHTEYIRKHLLRENEYYNSTYRETPKDSSLKYYGDLNKDFENEDITDMTLETTNWFEGDDGVYASVHDVARFFDDLMAGRILNQEYLDEMKTWDNEKDPNYGYGLMADRSFPYKLAMGHTGRGIGSTADAFYFPEQEITIIILSNSGLRAAHADYRKTYNKMRARIVKKIFLF